MLEDQWLLDAAHEIERLREIVEQAPFDFPTYRAATDAEIERLRNDLDSMIEHNDNQKAEIERLHTDLLTARGEAEDMSGEIAALREDRSELSERITDLLMPEIERLRQQVTQRGARMQLMREWMAFGLSGPTQNLWDDFKYDNPDAAEWFDQGGVPR